MSYIISFIAALQATETKDTTAHKPQSASAAKNNTATKILLFAGIIICLILAVTI